MKLFRLVFRMAEERKVKPVIEMGVEGSIKTARLRNKWEDTIGRIGQTMEEMKIMCSDSYLKRKKTAGRLPSLR